MKLTKEQTNEILEFRKGLCKLDEDLTNILYRIGILTNDNIDDSFELPECQENRSGGEE